MHTQKTWTSSKWPAKVFAREQFGCLVASCSQSLFRGIFELIIEESGGERSDDKGRKKKPLTNSPFSLLQFYFPSLPPRAVRSFPSFLSRASRLSPALTLLACPMLLVKPWEKASAGGRQVKTSGGWRHGERRDFGKNTLNAYYAAQNHWGFYDYKLDHWCYLILSCPPSLYFLLVCIYSLFVYHLLCVCYCRQQYSALEYVFDLSATRLKYLYLYIYICKQQLKALPELHISQVTGHQYNILSACAVHRPFFLYEAHLPDLSVHWLPEKNNEI